LLRRLTCSPYTSLGNKNNSGEKKTTLKAFKYDKLLKEYSGIPWESRGFQYRTSSLKLLSRVMPRGKINGYNK